MLVYIEYFLDIVFMPPFDHFSQSKDSLQPEDIEVFGPMTPEWALFRLEQKVLQDGVSLESREDRNALLRMLEFPFTPTQQEEFLDGRIFGLLRVIRGKKQRLASQEKTYEHKKTYEHNMKYASVNGKITEHDIVWNIVAIIEDFPELVDDIQNENLKEAVIWEIKNREEVRKKEAAQIESETAEKEAIYRTYWIQPYRSWRPILIDGENYYKAKKGTTNTMELIYVSPTWKTLLLGRWFPSHFKIIQSWKGDFRLMNPSDVNSTERFIEIIDVNNPTQLPEVTGIPPDAIPYEQYLRETWEAQQGFYENMLTEYFWNIGNSWGPTQSSTLIWEELEAANQEAETKINKIRALKRTERDTLIEALNSKRWEWESKIRFLWAGEVHSGIAWGVWYITAVMDNGLKLFLDTNGRIYWEEFLLKNNISTAWEQTHKEKYRFSMKVWYIDGADFINIYNTESWKYNIFSLKTGEIHVFPGFSEFDRISLDKPLKWPDEYQWDHEFFFAIYRGTMIFINLLGEGYPATGLPGHYFTNLDDKIVYRPRSPEWEGNQTNGVDNDVIQALVRPQLTVSQSNPEQTYEERFQNALHKLAPWFIPNIYFSTVKSITPLAIHSLLNSAQTSKLIMKKGRNSDTYKVFNLTIQLILEALKPGSFSTINGIFDEDMEMRVQEFQRENNLDDDGVVGKNTLWVILEKTVDT